MAIPEQLSYMRKYNIGQGAGAPGPVMMQPPSSPASAPAPAPTRTTPNYRAALASLPAGPLQDPVPNTLWQNFGPGMETSLPREQRQQQPNAVPAVGNVTASRPADRKLADGTPVFASDAKLNFGAAATPAAAPVQPAAAPQFERVLPASVPMTQTSTGRGGVIENPGDSTANKLQRALTSYSVKGSPSTRAAIAQAILGEAGARQNERMQTLKTQDQAALDAMKLNADAAKGNADRRLSADKFNAESQDTREHRRQLVELERSKPFQYEQGEDGTRTIVRNDGSLTPITDANGAPAKFVAPQRGLSHDVAFKAFNDRAQAIESGMGTAEEKAAALEALRQEPMFAQFVGAGQQAAAVPEVSARKAGEVYDTPKGKMKWTGTGWVSAQ